MCSRLSIQIFHVDNVLIREATWTEAMGGDFPANPMTLHATIWDAFDWATNGGRFMLSIQTLTCMVL